MWMQLGIPADSMLPPRFERLYQPERIAQFDRFFARGKPKAISCELCEDSAP
jgi:hypothetical protein